MTASIRSSTIVVIVDHHVLPLLDFNWPKETSDIGEQIKSNYFQLKVLVFKKKCGHWALMIHAHITTPTIYTQLSLIARACVVMRAIPWHSRDTPLLQCNLKVSVDGLLTLYEYKLGGLNIGLCF